jgi:hypothetical protein
MNEEPFACGVAFYKLMICGCVSFGKQRERERVRESGQIVQRNEEAIESD